jgi:plastocyanin
MTRGRTVAVLVAVWLVVAVGCDDGATSRDATRRRTAATTQAAAATGNGIVRGIVSFKGTAPEGEEIAAGKCHASSPATTASPVVVSAAGRLKDVVVYVKDAAPADVPMPGPAVLDQVNCRYVPNVLAVRTGQVVRVTSSDPTLHNVHVLALDNPGVNFGMTGAGQSRDLTFGVPERVRFKCDVHPWMSAHVYVFDHPAFAVTADDGNYEIKGLPPGEHTLVFSHPFLGDREREVKVSDGTPAEADVVFEKGEK